MIEHLTQDYFKSNIGTRFRVDGDTENLPKLELISCEDLGGSERQEQFSVVFCGGKDFLLPQQTYLLKNAGGDEFALFLVPVRQNEQGYYYEAMFNRFIK